MKIPVGSRKMKASWPLINGDSLSLLYMITSFLVYVCIGNSINSYSSRFDILNSENTTKVKFSNKEEISPKIFYILYAI